jgi:hypothetical protein
MLTSRTRKHKDVTFFNVTPAPHTVPILEVLGYERYCSGWFATVPALSASPAAARVTIATAHSHEKDLQPFERDLLLAHASYGCISAVCKSGNRAYPFVFMPRRKFRVIPFAYLVYCRDMADFIQFARPLGRFLAKAGFPVVVLDADGPISGLVGKYLNSRPKYFRGPHRPRLGDLAYSELAMFPVRGDRFWTGWPRSFLDAGASRKGWGHSK